MKSANTSGAWPKIIEATSNIQFVVYFEGCINPTIGFPEILVKLLCIHFAQQKRKNENEYPFFHRSKLKRITQ